MKTKAIIYSIVASIIILVVLNIFFAGNKHAVVVEENVDLVKTNTELKNENGALKVANSKLKAEKESVSTKLQVVDKQLKKVLTTTSQILPNAIVRIEDEIQIEMGWTNPQDAYEKLKDKLNYKPSKEEYQKTLIKLVEQNMLYHSSASDPYVKDKLVTMQEVKELVNNMPDEK